jgi:hypothetical protein
MTTAHEARLTMLANDGWQLRELLLPGGTPEGTGILPLTIAPFMAQYVVEVYDLLQRSRAFETDPFAGSSISLRTIRARLKLFDGDRKKFSGILELMTRCETASLRWFNANHKGVLGVLKRALQDDLGLFYYDDNLVLTTHVALVHSSFGELPDDDFESAPFEAFGRMNHAFGYQIGRFLGPVTDALASHRTSAAPGTTAAVVGRLTWSDCKARRAYGALSKTFGTDSGMSAPFTWLVCQVNLAHRWLRDILPSDAGLAFRIRFLTVFHALDALKVLGAVSARARSEPLAQLCASLLRTPDARRIRKLGALRNALAHYDTCDDPNVAPMEALVRKVASASTIEIAEIVDRTLEEMSDRFRPFVPKGSAPRPISEL